MISIVDMISMFLFNHFDLEPRIFIWYGEQIMGSMAGKRDFSLFDNVQIIPGAYPASYSIGERKNFPGSKAARVRS
jgi:hypothetical protein